MAVERYIAKSKSELSRLFGVSQTTVNRWVGLGMPVEDAGYDTGKIFQWHMEHLRDVWEEQSGSADKQRQAERYSKARTKKATEDARKQKRINDVAEGQLLYRSDMMARMTALGTQFRIAADTIVKTRKPAEVEAGKDIMRLVDIFAEELGKHSPEIRDIEMEVEDE